MILAIHFHMCRLLAGLFGLVAIMASLGNSALAAQSPWQGDPAIGEARLVSAVTATGDLDVLPLGVEFVLAPGWKIYWRTPGEAGLAPVVDLSQSPTPGLEGRFAWPMPKRFDAFGFDNFGYENAVILPFDVRGHVTGTPVQVTAELEALACADICVPLTATLDLRLPEGEALPSSHAQPMAQYAAMVPRQWKGDSSSGWRMAVRLWPTCLSKVWTGSLSRRLRRAVKGCSWPPCRPTRSILPGGRCC